VFVALGAALLLAFGALRTAKEARGIALMTGSPTRIDRRDRGIRRCFDGVPTAFMI